MSVEKRVAKGNVIWQGRLHLGDEPGFFGDATYCGVSIELPVELIPYPDRESYPDDVLLILTSEGVYPDHGYPGHRASVIGYLQSEDRWVEGPVLTEERLAGDSGGVVAFHLHGTVPRFVVLRVHVDQEFQPGLYSETVIRGLALDSASHYGYIGFRYST